MSQAETTSEPFCSLCYDPIDDDPLAALEHVIREHADAPEFQEFVDEVVVGQYCARCGAWFRSGVEYSPSRVFLAPPYCSDCRESNRALKNLLTERILPRELIARAWIPDE